MKLHWSPRSPYVRKVMMVALETGTDHRLERVRSVAAMLRPNQALMRDNPLSKIPTLVLDDGTALLDSAVICEYLNDLAGAPLFPQGREKWPALRWHALGDGLLDALILWRNERERPEPQRMPSLMAAFDTKAAATLALLDAESARLAGAPFAIGHVALACALGYLDFRFQDLDWRGRAPRLAAWFQGIEARASYRLTAPTLQG